VEAPVEMTYGKLMWWITRLWVSQRVIGKTKGKLTPFEVDAILGWVIRK
jgi:hypothetical protein